MKPEFQIREFDFNKDYDRVLSLWHGIEEGMQVGRSDTPDEIQKKIQRDPDLFLVSETGGDIVGTIIGGFDGRRGMVYHLAVHKDFRRQGIGAELLAEVEKRLQAKGCVKMYLLVLDDNIAAMRFYEECGWKHSQHDFVFAKEF